MHISKKLTISLCTLIQPLSDSGGGQGRAALKKKLWSAPPLDRWDTSKKEVLWKKFRSKIILRGATFKNVIFRFWGTLQTLKPYSSSTICSRKISKPVLEIFLLVLSGIFVEKIKFRNLQGIKNSCFQKNGQKNGLF